MNEKDLGEGGPDAGSGDLAGTPIFDALREHSHADPLVEIEQAEVLPPDAAARDAARREEAGAAEDGTLRDDEFRFVTRRVSDEERAAVIAVLTQVRAEETERVKRVERREREPWARSQRVPEGIGDLLAEG